MIGLTTRPAVCCIISRPYHIILFYFFQNVILADFICHINVVVFSIHTSVGHFVFFFIKTFAHLSYGQDI